MFIAITEQTENVLYIIGAFVGGVLITMIANLVSNIQIKILDKKQNIRNEMLVLLHDIQKDLSKHFVYRTFLSVENLDFDMKRLFNATLDMGFFYSRYKVYFDESKDFLKAMEVCDKYYNDLNDKIKSSLSQEEMKMLQEEQLFPMLNAYKKAGKILVKNLLTSLHKYSRQKVWKKKK